MAKCSACGRFASPTDGVKCSKCVGFFHRPCVNILQDARVSPAWLCPGCKAKTPRKDNTDQPVRGEDTNFTSPQEPPSSSASDEILREIKNMRQEMISFRGAFDEMRVEVSSLGKTLADFGGRMDGMEARLVGLEEKYAELQARPGVDDLLATVEHLRTELNDRDQEWFLNDVEITGIPEEQGENAEHLVRVPHQA